MNQQQQGKEPCTQCLGLSYYTQEMRVQRRNPICIGLQTSPTSITQLPDPQDHPSAEGPWSKHICAGCSFWPKAFAQGAKSSSSPRLPHCEGVELLLIKEAAEDIEEQPASTSSPSSSGRTQSDKSKAEDAKLPLWQRLSERASKNLEQMQAQLNNQGLVKFRETPVSYQQLSERLWTTAASNTERLRTGVEFAASFTYSTVQKFWNDRLNDR